MNATELQRLGPLARDLRLGCLCQNYLSSTKDTWTGTMIKGKIIHCDWGILFPIGHTVWVASDGSWSTQSPLRGPKKQITLGKLTLCPLW